ncbi:MAG: DUF5606 domain-containing protein [Salinivirgaceae bacterium]|nr:DUF5606 domain-containing protein [Salinivirgaceae bacterium]MBR3567087.1 DUF5606 domain-containing protein [Salinivirgaceae bacterium]MBR4621558.1 DUF5606 domain-containing protein [Salinivirgaceae bacterium]MBR6083899.1 DUF5606 domain-containing protein [Salinivirgaceae bacterium]
MKEILSISGYSGLFKLVSSTKNGIIVEDIETKKRMPAYSTSKVSSLRDIAIFKDDGEEVSLIEVLKNIGKKEKNKAAVDPKTADNEKLKAYFAEILPNYDRDRVYVSHIKKVLTWYNQLQRCNMLDVLDEKDDDAKADEKE